jgi:peptidoglycan/xylan/chitin deacetylase (PgdA/CDA1 family)
MLSGGEKTMGILQAARPEFIGRKRRNSSFILVSYSDSLDWKDPTPQQIASRVLSRVKPGSIVLFHNGAKNTPAALPTVLQTLQAQGYKIVPVSQLIYKSDYTIDTAGMQIPKSAVSKTPSSALPPK